MPSAPIKWLAKVGGAILKTGHDNLSDAVNKVFDDVNTLKSNCEAGEYGKPVVNTNVVTQAGAAALDAIQANPNVQGTLANKVHSAESNISSIGSDLTANNKKFRFAYNAATNEYGYLIAGSGGTDTFHPFSNAAELYKALQYSGLVNDGMTFSQMCDALETYFPEVFPVLQNIVTVTTAYNQTRETITAYYGDALDLTNIDKLIFNVKCDSKFQNSWFYNFIEYHVGISKSNTGAFEEAVNVYSVRHAAGGSREETYSGEFVLDVSGLSGKYYVGVQVYKGRDDYENDGNCDLQGTATITSLERVKKEIVIGGTVQYNTLWDAIQYNGNRTSYAYFFKYFTDDIFKPKYPMKLAGDNTDMFDDSRIKNSDKLAEFVDFSGCDVANGIFKESEFVSLPVLDFSNAVSMNDIFLRCQYLERIEKLIFGEKLETYHDAFGSTPVLSHIIIDGVFKNSVSFEDSPLLDAESVQSIIDALADYSEGRPAVVADAKSYTMQENFDGYTVDTLFSNLNTDVYNTRLGVSAYAAYSKVVQKYNVIPGTPTSEKVLEIKYKPGATHEADFRINLNDGYKHLLGSNATDQDVVFEMDLCVGGWSEKRNGFVIRIDQPMGEGYKSVARFLLTSDDNSAYMSRYVDSSSTVELAQLTKGQFHTLKVVIHKKEKRYSCYVDGVKLCSYVSALWTDFDSVGTVGLFVKTEDYESTYDARCMMWIDNLKVYVQDKAVELSNAPTVTFHPNIQLSSEQKAQIEAKGWIV